MACVAVADAGAAVEAVQPGRTRGPPHRPHARRATGKVLLTTLIRRILRLARAAPPWSNREPIREELFSVERLEEHARSLAAAQPVEPKPTKGHPLAPRLADNAAVLLEAYRLTVKAVDEGGIITPEIGRAHV